MFLRNLLFNNIEELFGIDFEDKLVSVVQLPPEKAFLEEVHV
jgi:hypothetical protein